MHHHEHQTVPSIMRRTPSSAPDAKVKEPVSGMVIDPVHLLRKTAHEPAYCRELISACTQPPLVLCMLAALEEPVLEWA